MCFPVVAPLLVHIGWSREDFVEPQLWTRNHFVFSFFGLPKTKTAFTKGHQIPQKTRSCPNRKLHQLFVPPSATVLDWISAQWPWKVRRGGCQVSFAAQCFTSTNPVLPSYTINPSGRVLSGVLVVAVVWMSRCEDAVVAPASLLTLMFLC